MIRNLYVSFSAFFHPEKLICLESFETILHSKNTQIFY